MSRKLKVLGLAVVAICAFGALSASAQAAIHWNYNGKALELKEAPEAGEAKVSENVELEESEFENGVKGKASVLTVSGLLRLSCTGLKIKEGKIKAPAADSATALEFTGCVVQNTKGEVQSKCTVKNAGGTAGIIKTTANTSALKEVSGKAYDVFTSTTGTFAEVVIAAVEGGSCGLSGTNKVTGTAALEVTLNGEGVTQHGVGSAAVVAAAGTALKYGERSAVLDGKGNLSLASGVKWGAVSP